MIFEMFIIFEILMFVLFCVAFFSKHEIMWAVSLVLTGIMIFNSTNIEYGLKVLSYPWLMGFNVLVFVLSVILLIFDLFDKYGGEKIVIPVKH